MTHPPAPIHLLGQDPASTGAIGPQPSDPHPPASEQQRRTGRQLTTANGDGLPERLPRTAPICRGGRSQSPPAPRSALEPRSRHQQQPRDQPHVLCLADGHWSSGLPTLQEALQRNEAPAVRSPCCLAPKTPRPQPQHWGQCWDGAPATDQELEALLAHQDRR